MSILGIKSEYSFLNSFLKIDEIIKYSKEKHYPFIAISDVGNVFCIYKLFKKAKENNIKPIIGCELNVRVDENIITPFCFYPKNKEGYFNLLKLLKISNYDKVEIKIDDLKKYCKEIIVISAGVSSFIYNSFPKIDITSYDKKVNSEEVLKFINYLKKFKAEIPNFKIGFSYDTFEAKTYINEVLYKISNNLNIPLLPFHTTCYFNYSDNKDFNDFIKIANIKNDINEACDFSFWDTKKIESEFLYKDVLKNLDKIISEINFEFEVFKIDIPKISDNANLELKNKCIDRLKKLKLEGSKDYLARLENELDVIDKMGFSNYFLIVCDLVDYAKKNNILVGSGRGSSAASLVAYLLNITEIDPLKYDLYFERFLNISRGQMPDIDIDFPDDKREDVISYLKDKYGISHIALITTFDTFGEKSAIRDITKIKEYNMKISSDKSIFGNIESEVLELSKKIEGLPRHTGTHPAGIIFLKDDVYNIFPVRKSQLGYYQIDFEMSELEDFKILKTDLLALRNLKIISDCINLIKARDSNFDIKNIRLDDKKTYDLLNNLQTDNIFQLESSGMKDVIKRLKPEKFDDIINLVALYRPGPLKIINDFIERKKGKEYKIIDEDIENIISPTYGFIIFQEQIMQIANKFANYTMAEADILRRGISKKNEQILIENEKKFIEKAILNGKDEKTAKKIYSYILEFSDYGFNKAHSVSYATITYKMAYLKANYFEYFALSVLNNSIGDNQITIKYLDILENNGYKVMPPILDIATDEYKLDGNKVYFPFQIVKGISIDSARKIVKKRAESKFLDMKDFMERTSNFLNNSQVLSLIFASAFDNFSNNKKKLVNKLNNDFFEELIEVKEEECKDFALEDLIENEMKSYGFNYFYNPINKIKELSSKINIPYFSKVQSVNSGYYLARIISHEVKKYFKDGVYKNYMTVILTDEKIKIRAVCFKEEVFNKKGLFWDNNIFKVQLRKGIYKEKESYTIDKLEVINTVLNSKK